MCKEDAAARDPPRVNSALIRVYINGQELLALLDTGCEVDLVSEKTARRCSLPVHSLAQSLRLRFADGRQNARIGKVTGVKCQFQSEMGTIDTVWDFYVGPVHHDVILGMPWVTQWKARMRPLQAAIEGCAPGDEERVHLSVPPTTLTSSNVSWVEPLPQRNEEITAPRQLRVAAEAGGEKHAPRPNGDGNFIGGFTPPDTRGTAEVGITQEGVRRGTQ